MTSERKRILEPCSQAFPAHTQSPDMIEHLKDPVIESGQRKTYVLAPVL